MILHQTPDDMPLRQPVGDAGPGAAAIGASVHVRRQVTGLVVVHDRINRVGIVEVSLEVVDEEVVRHAGQPLDGTPVGAAVLGNVDSPVVRTGVQQALHQRRFGEGGDGPVARHRKQIPRRVETPHTTHHRLGEAVAAMRQIAADGCPAVAPVVGTPNPLAGEI
jgi:hypothetical protein